MAICEQVDFMHATGINKDYDLAQNEFTSTVGKIHLFSCWQCREQLWKSSLPYRNIHNLLGIWFYYIEVYTDDTRIDRRLCNQSITKDSSWRIG